MLRYLRYLSAGTAIRAHFETSARGCSAQATASSAQSASTESRWRRLSRERRKAPTPANRTAYVFDRNVPSTLPVALEHVRGAAWAKFDESVELIFRLNIDPRLADQNIRGVISLPHGTGRTVRVAVFADPDVASAALAAGADLAGADELVDSIAADDGASVKGFSACIAQPHLMSVAGAKLGKILGPRGLMPSPKSGTVSMDVVQVLQNIKKGQVSYRTDRAGNLHLIVGKLSFTDQQLEENVVAATRAVMEARPQSVRKRYLKKAVICSTMGPSVSLDRDSLVRLSVQ